jgi:hypothetical protein
MLVAREGLKTLFQGLAVVAVLSSTVTAVIQSRENSKSVTESPAVNGIRIVRSNVHHDVSLPLRDLIQANQAVITSPLPEDLQEAEPVHPIPLPQGLKPAADPDPVLQGAALLAPAQLGPTAGLAFEGLGDATLGFTVHGAPPDTNGAVGLTQYVQWVNTSFGIFAKSTGALISGVTPGNTLWKGFGGGCEVNNNGDPIVTYDRLADRWVFSQFSVAGTPFLQCVAVSTTPDATGSYNRYSFAYNDFDDYPKMGVWPDAYYVTFNMFNGNAFVGADACAYDRNAMLNGLAATQICFQQGPSVGGLLPSDFDGTTPPPGGSPNFMIFFGSNSLQLFTFHVDFVTPGNSTFTGPTNIPVAAFTPLCNGGTCVQQPPQPGLPNQQLDSLADRLMYRLAYRNFGDHESLVLNHSVTAGAGGGVRWYELQNPNGAVTVAQQSTFAPDAAFRWMGSIAMDRVGDMALGYSVSSTSISPSIFITGRTPSDPASTMQAETQVMAGNGSQTSGSRSLSRWGDYSAMQVDPADDCTFWFTTEYIKNTGIFNWNTRISSFKFPNCVSPATPDFSLSASPASVTLTQGNMVTSTITVNPLNGFNGTVSFLASGLPSGLTASFNPTSGTSTTTLTLTASSPVSVGTATVTITGTSGNLSHTTTVTVIFGLRFVPVAPCRIADTRSPNGPFGGPFLRGGGSRAFVISDSGCGIPTTAQAYSVNATVVPRGVLGFLTTFPCANPLPATSTLNAIDGRVKAGAAIVPAGANGTVCTFATNDTDLVLDINGYFVPSSDTSALAFYPLTPCRLVDTRGPAGPLGGPSLVGNAARTFPILSSSCNVPMAAQAYSLNFTSVPSGTLGFLTTWPAGQPQPLVSTLNAPTGVVTANAAIVPSGTNGDISVFVTNNSDVVIDINGYFAPPGPGGLSLFTLNPCRVLDTRNPPGSPPFSGAINVNVTASGCGAPASAQAYNLNATVVPPGVLGFLTLWPQGATQPLVSTLNAIDGAVTSNLAIVPTTNGSVSAFAQNPTHLILDISGFFAP